MSLSYKVWSEEEDKMRGLINPGVYNFKVDAIQRTLTAKGNYEMLVVDLKVIDSSGTERRLKDWIVLMDEMGWKLRHFAASCGLLDKYEAGNIDHADFTGKSGSLRIILADKKDRDGNTTGEKSSKVADYIKPSAALSLVSANNASDDFSDPIPF